MKHLGSITRNVPVAFATTSLQTKTQFILDFVDATELAMRQAAWGIKPGGLGGGTTTGGTTTGGTTTTTTDTTTTV